MQNLNSTFRQQAKESLSGNWGAAILILFVCMLISGVIGLIPIIGYLSFLISLPLGYGMSIIFLRIARGQSFELGNLFDGFNNYKDVFTTTFICQVLIMLWALLLIVPGIIKAYSYAMVNYILADTGKTNMQALRESEAMMYGHRRRLFMLDLTFIGLTILSIVSLCIAMLWILPWWYTARAKFYIDLKESAAQAQIEQ